MRIDKYSEFIKEGFFRKIKKSKIKSTSSDRINNCVSEIMKFLEENGVFNWSQFLKMSPFKRDVINKLIDHSVKNMNELKEVTFMLKLELSDRLQLRELLSELESEEEYEKCSQVLKKLTK
jgi:hypothetical protein